MNFRRFSLHKCCLSYSSSASTSSLPWISPLEVLKGNSRKPDPPDKASNTDVETQKRSKFISHEASMSLIKRERSPQCALEIFNAVSEQKGFGHNNATYATILEKVARHQMSCLFVSVKMECRECSNCANYVSGNGVQARDKCTDSFD